MTKDNELMARFGLELDGDNCLALTPEVRMQLHHREGLLRDRISAEMFRILLEARTRAFEKYLREKEQSDDSDRD